MDPYQTLSEYDSIKTFKLNDAYEVVIFDNVKGNLESLKEYGFKDSDLKLYGITLIGDNAAFPFKNCTKINPPSYEPTIEVIKFCNTTREIYLPNTKSPGNLQLEFAESERMYIHKFIKYCLTKNFFDEGMNYERDHYKPYSFINQIDISIYDNSLRHKTMTHRFFGCKLAKYDYGLELDYAGSEVLHPKMEFNFLKYSIIYGDEENIEKEDILSALNADMEAIIAEKKRKATEAMSGYTPRNQTQTTNPPDIPTGYQSVEPGKQNGGSPAL